MTYDINENDLNIDNTETVNPSQTSTPDATPNTQTFEYIANGKTISEDMDTILKRAGMGYNYAQHMNEFKQKQADFEAREQQVSQTEEKWKPYAEYAEQNPEWGEHVRSSWENRTGFNSNGLGQTPEQSGLNQNTQTQSPELQQLASEFRSLKQAYEGDKQAQLQERQDSELNSQIAVVRKEYPNIDFSVTNPDTGKSLEHQVLEHGAMNGISSFRASFRDFHHDQLMKSAVSTAKETTAQELQQRQQKGFMSTSDTPQLVPNNNGSIRNKSYQQIVQEGGKELNLF